MFPLLPEPIQTNRLTLRIMRQADLPALLLFYSNPAFIRYLPNALWRGMDDAQHWYERISMCQSAGEMLQFVIVEARTSTVIGICLAFNFDHPGNRAEIGYALGPAFQGRGFAREAVASLLHFCFVTCDLRRIDAGIDPRNIASRKIVDAFGFVHEGTIREKTLMQGEIVDADLFGLLKKEWITLPIPMPISDRF